MVNLNTPSQEKLERTNKTSVKEFSFDNSTSFPETFFQPPAGAWYEIDGLVLTGWDGVANPIDFQIQYRNRANDWKTIVGVGSTSRGPLNTSIMFPNPLRTRRGTGTNNVMRIIKIAGNSTNFDITVSIIGRMKNV